MQVLPPRIRLVVTFLIAIGLPSDARAESPLRVLFVGNSLTATHDLPSIVEALSEAGSKPVETGALVAPNVALEDHWAVGRAQREIESGRWDVVVLQQGPSSLDSSRAHLITWTCRFSELARASGVRPAIFSVWPSKSRHHVHPRVLASYRAAAEHCGALYFPVGDAWANVWSSGPGVELRGPDGFHPSIEGSLLAALAIWAGLTDAEPEALSDRALRRASRSRRLSATTLSELRRAARDAREDAPDPTEPGAPAISIPTP